MFFYTYRMQVKYLHRLFNYLRKISFLISVLFTFIVFKPFPVKAQSKDSLIAVFDTSDYVRGDINFNLLIAAEKGYNKEVLRLLKTGADVNTRTYEGVTPLMYAVQNEHFEACKILLLNSAEPNLKPYNGIPALITAVKLGNLEIAEYLIRKDADVDIEDNEGITSLMYAAAFNYFEICDMLLYYNASVNLQDNEGNTALIVAAYYGNTDIVELLINSKATLEKSDNKGFTPLHCASQNGNIEIAKLLVSNGASPDLKNKPGYSSLSLSILNNNTGLTKFLVDSGGSDVNSKICPSMYPLNLVKKVKNDTIYSLLKSKGARRSFTPAFNYSSIDFALNFSSDDFIFGFGCSFYDTRYGLTLGTGYSIRTKAQEVLSHKEGNVYYQYWERRSYLHLDLIERIHLISWGGVNSFGIAGGYQAQYHFASYRGTRVNPKKGFFLVPEVALFVKLNGIAFSVDYEKLDIQTTGISKNRINLGIHFLIRSKQLKQSTKKVLWYL
jgi:ankyrin repeat protein